MRRRHLLAAGLAGVGAGLAGCSNVGREPWATLELSEPEDWQLAGEVSVPADRLDRGGDELVPELVDAGTATVRDVHPPIETTRLVGHGDRYYDVTWTVVDGEPAHWYQLLIDPDPPLPAPVRGRVAVADLAGVDREAVLALLRRTDEVDVDGTPSDEADVDGTSSDRSGTTARLALDASAALASRERDRVSERFLYEAEEAERSVLVPDPGVDVVDYEGRPVRVRVDTGHADTVATYRYTAEAVASDVATVADVARERYAIDLPDLSDAQRRILEAARADGYGESRPTRAFRDLLAHLRNRRAAELDDDEGVWYVRLDGTVYRASLQLSRPLDEVTPDRETPSAY